MVKFYIQMTLSNLHGEGVHAKLMILSHLRGEGVHANDTLSFAW